MKRNILLVMLVLMAIAAGVGYYLYNKPAETTISSDADHTVSATELFAEFEQNEEAANSKYLNKVVAVTGKVSGLEPGANGATTVSLESGSDMFGVTCEIADPAEGAGIKTGETITVKGLCTGMLMDVVLVKCSVEN